jgi:chromosome segregation ATPase
MKRTLLSAAITLSLTTFAVAAPAAPAAAPADNVAQWEAVVKAREQRVNLLRDELKSLDARMETRVDSLVDALTAIGDSKDSKTKVARMKEKTMTALNNSINYYQNKRASMQEELRRPTLNLTEEQKRRAIAVFDAHMEKRVAQILKLQKSLPTEKDYDRYKATGSNWWGTEYVMNEDYKQNLRVSSVTNTQRREIEAGLRKSIARLEQQNKDLRAKGAPAEELAKNEALIAERRKQLGTALAPVETPTRQIGGKEAADLDKSLQTAASDLKRDFNTLFAKYNAFLQEVGALNGSRTALAAAKAKK